MLKLKVMYCLSIKDAKPSLWLAINFFKIKNHLNQVPEQLLNLFETNLSLMLIDDFSEQSQSSFEIILIRIQE